MSLTLSSQGSSSIASASSERDILLTLMDLGRQVASVVELDESEAVPMQIVVGGPAVSITVQLPT